MKKAILLIDGMTCSACSNGLEKYVKKQRGVLNAYVNLVMATLNVEYDESELRLVDIEKFVASAGFKSLGEFKKLEPQKQEKSQKIKFIIGAVLLLLMMWLSMFTNFEPTHKVWVLSLLGTVFLFEGRKTLSSGVKNLIHLMPNMDSLITLGVVTSFLYSLYIAVFAIDAPVYFESAAMIIYFVLLGRMIEGGARQKTLEAVQKLVTITPDFAVLFKNGKEQKVTLDEVKKGDVLAVYAGDKAAVDGVIVEGSAHFDESFITGESKPVKKQIGNTVLAGSFNYDGYVLYEAKNIGKQSSVSQIVQMVTEAAASKPKTARVADEVSGVFVPVIIALALMTFIFYLWYGADLSFAVIKFVTVLVASCPCALGLAVPLAVVMGEGLALKEGILIKKADVLERAKDINAVLFDKTGTLTQGKPKIAKIFNYSNLSDDDLIKTAAALEEKSAHPIANAFKAYLFERKIKAGRIEKFENLAGLGLKGVVGGKEVVLGNAKLLKECGLKAKLSDEKALTDEQNSIVYVAIDGKVSGLIGIKDMLKENAAELIKALESKKIDVWMLTGDNESTAQKVASMVGIKNVMANVLPNQKTQKVRELKNAGLKVMMVGDGINDSPALTASDIGLSIDTGTEIAVSSADVVLKNDHLMNIVKLFDISKKTFKIIKQNLFWAFFYNMLMLPVAMGFLATFGIELSPHIASLAMVLSSMFVVGNTLRLR
ncbi:MAG: heavy metal translocating P-type ATPase [Alphaproteobacteria bacterium]|nr:heavy metal translocating P-type ATPase [Alphaproteobacteria bacterium]